MNLRRFDTLFVRLFVLMWATLVASHLVAYAVAVPMAAPARPAGPPSDRLDPARLPTLPSLPPGNPFTAGELRAPGDAGPRALPREALWLDYGLRLLVIGLGAALGARWLSRPMRALARAAGSLSHGFAQGRAPSPLSGLGGTAEVRETARLFDDMAARLQEQFDARGMQLAAVSHDLLTPLTRLRLRLEAAPPALAAAAAADIREMSDMIDDSLAVLREQREGSEAELVDLRSLLESLVDDQAAAGHDVALGATVEARVRVRPAALRRVLGNLVGNALRYGGHARLALAPEDGGIVVTVDDDGPGIPLEQLELAFRPWVRLDQAHARAGHGLGLAIARDLAGRDGGRLTLANREQGGLRARLWLPVATTVSGRTR